ncbi:hypothetical protein VIN7_5341 [Saccharomyces cerevisiae x Saccharomyces kudriavzevii VIN7]|uniref:Uncharacterized protein n=1 Tax=Saccharomyces cerevisiae x Saccharomyces kudriavzevii (strain VIN7) TaxID=1095631 RepID=H0GQQ4_SACCK|nr:hypothetical protein VIN7_5341 [Saccharomyces cerevisiae x Saccharomyces kudriavzevii VIN7]
MLLCIKLLKYGDDKDSVLVWRLPRLSYLRTFFRVASKDTAMIFTKQKSISYEAVIMFACYGLMENVQRINFRFSFPGVVSFLGLFFFTEIQMLCRRRSFSKKFIQLSKEIIANSPGIHVENTGNVSQCASTLLYII